MTETSSWEIILRWEGNPWSFFFLKKKNSDFSLTSVTGPRGKSNTAVEQQSIPSIRRRLKPGWNGIALVWKHNNILQELHGTKETFSPILSRWNFRLPSARTIIVLACNIVVESYLRKLTQALDRCCLFTYQVRFSTISCQKYILAAKRKQNVSTNAE